MTTKPIRNLIDFCLKERTDWNADSQQVVSLAKQAEKSLATLEAEQIGDTDDLARRSYEAMLMEKR